MELWNIIMEDHLFDFISKLNNDSNVIELKKILFKCNYKFSCHVFEILDKI